MSAAPVKRGERKARWMLNIMDNAGVVASPVWVNGDGWGLKFIGHSDYSPEQRAVAADSVIFGIAYPRCFGTLVRLLNEREGR
jgi:hypothetical protein